MRLIFHLEIFAFEPWLDFFQELRLDFGEPLGSLCVCKTHEYEIGELDLREPHETFERRVALFAAAHSIALHWPWPWRCLGMDGGLLDS